MSKRRCATVVALPALPDDAWQCILEQVPLQDVATVLNLLGTCRTVGRMLWPRLGAWLACLACLCNHTYGEFVDACPGCDALFDALRWFWASDGYARFWDTAYLYAQRKELVLAPVSSLIYTLHLSVLSHRLLASPPTVIHGKSGMLAAPLSQAYCYYEGVVTPVLKMSEFRTMVMGEQETADWVMKHRFSPHLKGYDAVKDCPDAMRALLLMNDEIVGPGSFMRFTHCRTLVYNEPQPDDLVCNLVTLVAQRSGPRRYEPVWLGKYAAWWSHLYCYSGAAEDASAAIRLHVNEDALRSRERTRLAELYEQGNLF